MTSDRSPAETAPALAGIRVVDLSNVVFGPSATQVLADYGADVIKVEPPTGDSTRTTSHSAEPGMAGLYLGCNRNKRSLLLDLKTEAGQEAMTRLIATADVFIHNLRPQKLAPIGLEPDRLMALNPRLIFVGLHGFGMDGPYAGSPAYDDIVQALSGVADLSRRQTGDLRYMSTVVADKVAGQMAAHAVLAALFQRERTGRGQFVEVPMLECAVQFMLIEHMAARHVVAAEGETSPRRDEFGYARTLSPKRKPYATADGHVCFMPYNDRNWSDFLDAAGLCALKQDPRFANLAARTRHIDALLGILEETLASQPSAHWLALGKKLGIACAPINALEDLEGDPHLAAVGMFQTIESDGDWHMRYVRNPVRLTDSHVPARMPPRLGEHTQEILDELGLGGADGN